MKNTKVSIVDYGMGNIGSIINMINYLGHDAEVVSNISEIEESTKLILPGVGRFDEAIKNINALGIKEVIESKVMRQKTPILGICLGMQLMTNKSEEGKMEGLSFIDAQCKRFSPEKMSDKVPHMGWNQVNIEKKSKLLENIGEAPRFYHVHSYYVECNDKQDVLLTTNYINPFVSAFEKENILGVQFHPEKSHKFGIKLFDNFINNF